MQDPGLAGSVKAERNKLHTESLQKTIMKILFGIPERQNPQGCILFPGEENLWKADRE